MFVRWLALLALYFAATARERAVAQSATSAEQLAEAVRVEPSTDRCLSEAIVRARVLKRLARDARLSDVQVIVHVADAPRLEVLRGGQLIAERRFESFPDSCNARRDAIAVAVALAIERAREAEVAPAADDSASGATTGTSAGAAATTEAATAGTKPAEQARAANTSQSTESDSAAEDPSDPVDSSLELGVHAGVAAIVEILPALAFAGVLGADAKVGDIRLSLSALGSLEHRDDVLGAQVDSRLLLGRALACGDLTSLGNVALEGCAGVLAGAAFASGRGYDSDRSTELGYVGALARAALRFPARGMLAGRLALDGLVPLMRPSYVLREGGSDQTTAITPAPIGAALSAEIVLTLP